MDAYENLWQTEPRLDEADTGLHDFHDEERHYPPAGQCEHNGANQQHQSKAKRDVRRPTVKVLHKLRVEPRSWSRLQRV